MLFKGFGFFFLLFDLIKSYCIINYYVCQQLGRNFDKLTKTPTLTLVAKNKYQQDGKSIYVLEMCYAKKRRVSG